MNPFLSRLHADIRGARTTHRGVMVRPEDAPRGLHKEYPRMPRISLPAPETLAMTLSDTLKQRESFDRARNNRPFSLPEISTLLGNALGMRAATTRTYPSGGALYPIETYLVGNVIAEHTRGVFHYHPKAHALEYLWDMPAPLSISNIINSPVTPLSEIVLIFTAVWGRSSIKYGDWAYHTALFEAGHMAQNILLATTAMRAQARPVGGFSDDIIADLLDIDEREQPVYSILLSPGPDLV